MTSEGRFGWMTTIAVGSFAVKVIANSLLVPRFGIAGAQISTAVMYASAFCVYMSVLLFHPPSKNVSA
jgi:putative peptidoglycan lipid II flippase